MTPVGKKIIKRKPKGGATPAEFYFSAATQDSIVAYKQETSQEAREKIYVNEIMPAFNKLVENLINVYGFQIQYESKGDLQNECVQFLYGTITKFDPTKGTKAFSYFNVVAKNYLIIKSKQSNRHLHTFLSIDDGDNLSIHDLETIEGWNISPSPEEVLVSAVDAKKLGCVLDMVQAQLATDAEAECFRGIKTLFDNIHDLDFLNKRAVMVYLRSLTSLSPKQLSAVLSTVKRYYKTANRQYEENKS